MFAAGFQLRALMIFIMHVLFPLGRTNEKITSNANTEMYGRFFDFTSFFNIRRHTKKEKPLLSNTCLEIKVIYH